MQRALALLSLILFASPLGAADTASVLEAARAKQAARWKSVENYTVVVRVNDSGGLQTPVFYEKMKVGDQVAFRMVSPAEYYRKTSERAGFPPSKEFMAGMAPALDMAAGAAAAGDADSPGMDFRGMTSQMSMFLRAGANAKEDDGKADAAKAVGDFAEFAQRARLAGTEQVMATSGSPGAMREAYRLVADNLTDIKLDQPKGSAKFRLKTATLWLDKEHLVPLRLLMEGEAENKGKKTPIGIEKLDLDYKQVGPLYESHHQVYRLSGLMSGLSEKDRKEMEKAKVDFEKAKAQLETMPPQQREMVEKMMKGQMEKFEAMTSGDAITSTTDVMSIAVNEGPPTPYGPGTLTVGGPAAATYPAALTIAGDNPGAELAIAARIPGQAEAIIGLKCAAPFPKSGQVEISGASGHARIEGSAGAKVSIEGGSGTITVTKRTETRIVGTFTALLTAPGEGNKKIHFSASGDFDTGAPVGPMKELRGSPIPANLFGGG
jgi:hypothetical protein